jgi:hypothetical protein
LSPATIPEGTAPSKKVTPIISNQNRENAEQAGVEKFVPFSLNSSFTLGDDNATPIFLPPASAPPSKRKTRFDEYCGQVVNI